MTGARPVPGTCWAGRQPLPHHATHPTPPTPTPAAKADPMRFAVDPAGNRLAAAPRTRGHCPGCNAPVQAKCGEVLTWHWAHLADTGCTWDPEPETAWHRNWKSCAPTDRQEISLNGCRADIISPSGLVIELQHSHLPGEHIRKREAAYRHMVWLFDAREPFAANRLRLNRHPDRPINDLYWTIRWDRPPAYPSQATATMFLDLDEYTLIWVGAWYDNPDDNAKSGYGWVVTPEWFERVIINGPHMPARPSARRPLTIELLEDHIRRPYVADVVGPLDWSSHRVNTRRKPCICCARSTWLCDENGQACHKACAENDPVEPERDA